MAPVVPCPVLIGRAAELDVLRRALDGSVRLENEFKVVIARA